ncbi:hypothetical protein ACHAXA_011181 [Cyclostephanos tholiformis]|uniref:Condensation domain-containing protein n=1 Tax=Cyclostephanos tholiformis TaxID=382380 RepID=A0ABD3R6Z4_9STRA
MLHARRISASLAAPSWWRRRAECLMRRRPRSSSSSSSSSSSGIGERRRRRAGRIFLSTSVVSGFRVPLTLADVHLRHEHLPFLYVFRSNLDPDRLISSLSEVLRRYPILGATVVGLSPPPENDGRLWGAGGVCDIVSPALVCDAGNTVPVSFDSIDMTLDQWRRGMQ